MKPLNAILGAALAAAALAAPASAAPSQNFAHTVTASSGSIQAACVFRPDNLTLDYPPTSVDGYVASTITPSAVSVRCSAYRGSTFLGDEWASGTNVATLTGGRVGFFGTNSSIKICVDAYAASTVIDTGDQAHACRYV